jgi:hypothetical protein
MKTATGESRRTVLGTAIVVEGGLVLLALAVGWLFGQPPLAQIEWTMPAALVGIAAAVPMVAALVLVTRFPVGPLAELENVVRRMIVPLFRDSSLVDLAAICALAGLGEEMLFRGVAQAGLERFSGSPWLALAVASVLFGLAHPITPTYAVVAGLIGVYLGWLLLASGNLLVPVVAHAAYDFAALVYLLQDTDVPPEELPSAEEYGDEWSI